MTDVFTAKKRSAVMSHICSKNTRPELKLRKALHHNGYRYRLHVESLPGKPDIVFPKYRTVVQVRGCFWHGHICIDGHLPKSNKKYWKPKLLNNMLRDQKNDLALQNENWTVVIVWECTITNQKGLSNQVKRICSVLK